MAGLTIRNLDEPLKKRLRIQAAHNGRSMEEEVRQILRHVLETGFMTPEALAPHGAGFQSALPTPPTKIAAVPLAIAAAPSASYASLETSAPSVPYAPSVPAAPRQADLAATADASGSPSETQGTVAADSVDRPSPLQTSRSVEAFTDGLRQRLALLVGVDTSAVPRS